MPTVTILFADTVTTGVKSFILKTLNDANVKDIAFAEVNTGEVPMVSAGIHPNSDIVHELGKIYSGLSVATINGPLPRKVWLNRENFESPPAHFDTPDDYRRYVVLHEFTHALGLGHVSTTKGEPCAIMTPQTFKPTCTPTHEFQKKDRDSLRNGVNIFNTGRRA
jgi:hypothetical protein